MIQCPECDKMVEPVARGRFKVQCYPTHYARTRQDMTTPEERDQWYADHRESSRLHESDICPASGQPVDL
jgi:hypothetical protein